MTHFSNLYIIVCSNCISLTNHGVNLPWAALNAFVGRPKVRVSARDYRRLMAQIAFRLLSSAFSSLFDISAYFVTPVTYLSRDPSKFFSYTARMGSIDTILNVGPQWATTSIRRRRSIGREIRPPRRFSVLSRNISMSSRRYIRRSTRKSTASGERPFVRLLISFLNAAISRKASRGCVVLNVKKSSSLRFHAASPRAVHHETRNGRCCLRTLKFSTPSDATIIKRP
jgi:hypothetical protein